MTGRIITESQIIGSRIREVRVKKAMSQAELAVRQIFLCRISAT